MSNKQIKIILFFLSMVGKAFNANSQVALNGPTCVTYGLEYQYLINAGADSTINIQVCVDGGRIKDSGSACYNGIAIRAINVYWNDTTVNGRITLTTSQGTTSLTTAVAHSLQPGEIDSVLRFQVASKDSIPASLICSAAQNGSCIPMYQYQWQSSIDNIHWIDVQDGVNKDLSFSTPVQQTTWFRRKVTETSSGIISFSDTALLVILE